jgi:hypothetical protein
MFSSLEAWFVAQLKDLDLIELLFLWAGLIILPVVAPLVTYAGFAALVKRDERRKDLAFDLGMAFGGLAVSVISIGALIATIRHFPEAMASTVAAGGTFLVACLACLAALPFGWLGYELRISTYAMKRKYRGSRSRAALWRTAIGFVVLAGLSTGLYNYSDVQTWRVVSLGMLVVIGLGCFGFFFVPIDLE